MTGKYLRERFSSTKSFMYFAEGLRAYRSYQGSDCVADLNDSSKEFERAVTFYPQDALSHFYFALIRLEQVSALDRPPNASEPQKDAAILKDATATSVIADPAKTSLREGWIQDALLHFEHYQGGREIADPNDSWLYLWSEYNRAAAQVHRLNPQGYLRARGILIKHLANDQSPQLSQLIYLPDLAPKPISRRSSQPVETLTLNRDLFRNDSLRVRVGFWWNDLFLRNGYRVRARDRRREIEKVLKNVDRNEYRGLLLQMESLVNLTRARPLREPESLRQLAGEASLGLEPVEAVEESLATFIGELDELRAHNQISVAAERDLRSDYWSQRGHLECANALEASGWTADDIRREWNDLTRPLDNREAFRVMVQPKLRKVRPIIEKAANYFRTALSHQPRWIPALKSRDEMEVLLRGERG
jgi:hypothetical protein